jgi:two-component system response regulator DegU
MNKKIRLLIVDDQELFREGLLTLLSIQKDFEIVSQASSGEEAILATTKTNPDVILMDLRMSGIGGVEATKRIVQQHPGIKIIV